MAEERDISQILVDYGVYNQNGVNVYKLDVELNVLMNKVLLEQLKIFKKIYMDRDKMGQVLDKTIKEVKDTIENYG